MGRYLSAFFTFVLVATLAWGCSGSSSKWGDRFHDEMLSYDEQPTVSFTISGSLNCERCEEDGTSVAGVMVEVIPKTDPTNMLAAKMFDGTGPFEMPIIRWKSGAELTITAMVFTEVDRAQFTETKTVVVPDEDGDTIAVVINF